ncbi:MAG: acyl-CoA dehydrogenase family protein [Anaerolinea sp.]|nr:acyl-CoA dehydrogenase family protein [Anaerolinea sp.]
MISFTPTEEQKMLVDAIKKFAQGDVANIAHDADEDAHLPPEIVQKGWELGLLPAGIPEQYGGFGEYSAVTNVLAYEEFAYGDLSLALAVNSPALVALPLLMSGTEEQKAKILPLVASESLPALTAAFMEPGIAFDPVHPKTVVRREGDCYILEGVKCYVPMAKDARLMLVYARDSESGKVDGYLVEGDTDGLQVSGREKLMGVRALPTYQVTLNNVSVGLENKLGGEAGTRYSRLLSHSRIGLAAMAVGMSRAAFDYARQYAKERVQFGQPIATKQSIAFMLAEMAIEIDAARLLVWEAAWKLDTRADADGSAESRLAKDYADKTALFVADGALQTLGGHGYIREHPVERFLRNGRGFATFEGLAMA